MGVIGDDEVRSWVATEARHVEDRPTTAGWLQRMCRSAARHLPADGVGLSLADSTGGLMPAAASSARCLRVGELQYVLGEGPCLAAHATGSPVLVPDLGAAVSTSWPAYAPAAHQEGIRAVFAFPLQVGHARVGAMDVYRDEPGALTSWTLQRAHGFAHIAMEALLGSYQRGQVEDGWLDDLDDLGGYPLYQAQGMVMIQLDVRLTRPWHGFEPTPSHMVGGLAPWRKGSSAASSHSPPVIPKPTSDEGPCSDR